MQNGHELALQLRSLINQSYGVFLYGVTMVPEAIGVDEVGHDGYYIGGYAAAAARGVPDLGILSGTEMLAHIQGFTDCNRITIPALADADDGYGGVHNVRRTVRDLLTKTAIAAIHIEDQESPKRCGHIAGKRVLPLDVAVGKIRAAVAMRDDIDPMRIIVARTDAAGAANSKGIKDAILRARAYLDAGVDAVWCESASANDPRDAQFARGVHKTHPNAILAINISPSFDDWEKCDRTTGELIDLGYMLRFATYPALKASVAAVVESAREFLEDEIRGIKKLAALTKGGPAESIKRLIGLDTFQEIEARFDPRAGRAQKKSEGYRHGAMRKRKS